MLSLVMIGLLVAVAVLVFVEPVVVLLPSANAKPANSISDAVNKVSLLMLLILL